MSLYICSFLFTFVSLLDETDEDADAFVLRDVLNYMEEYFKAERFEESANKLTIIDQEDETTTTSNDEPLIFVDHHAYFVVVSYALHFSSDLEISQSWVFVSLLNIQHHKTIPAKTSTLCWSNHEK